mmetsp:Transcript_5548/g.12293  ORF Transcript_5548/g.12293 Transcript_5548/m.12293 type:complete len:203 (+) Transcript_5548:276-884(+)
MLPKGFCGGFANRFGGGLAKGFGGALLNRGGGAPGPAPAPFANCFSNSSSDRALVGMGGAAAAIGPGLPSFSAAAGPPGFAALASSMKLIFTPWTGGAPDGLPSWLRLPAGSPLSRWLSSIRSFRSTSSYPKMSIAFLFSACLLAFSASSCSLMASLSRSKSAAVILAGGTRLTGRCSLGSSSSSHNASSSLRKGPSSLSRR